MILTLTPNPSVDILFEAGTLVWDDANRVAAPRRRPGGQGINLVRAAIRLGGEAIAVAPLGGPAGAELREMLESEATPLRAVPIAGETRVFVGVRERDTGRSLLLNPRGPDYEPHESDALLDAVSQAMAERAPKWVVGCGSIPPKGDADLYARLASLAHERGARFVPDCDGEPLRLAASRADLLAPNAHEAARLTGRAVECAEDAVQACRSLLGMGAGIAIVKLGGDGAVLAARSGATGSGRSPGGGMEGAWVARGPVLHEGSAVGAGDAFLAAVLIALENAEPLPEVLRGGVAAGTAVLLSRGAELLRREDADRVRREVRVDAVA